jgi:hypothetical protein
MTRRRLLAAAVCGLAGAAVLRAAEPAGIQVKPVLADGQVSVSFSAPSALADDELAVARSGLLLTFTFTAEVRRPTGLWWDRTVGAATVSSSVKFDNLTGVYLVSKLRDGHVTWSERTTELEQVRHWMTAFDRVPLVAADRLEPNAEYYVAVKLRTSPRRTFSLWPWPSHSASGRAEFTNVR